MSTLKVGPVTLCTKVRPALYGSGWRWWIELGVETLEMATRYCDTEAEAQAAADAALAAIAASMLRDLFSGPEWAGLAEALQRASTYAPVESARTVASCTQARQDTALLRKLAEKLEVTP